MLMNPTISKKEDWVYQFMNFLFRYDVQAHNFQTRSFLSTRKDAEFMFKASYLSCIIPFILPEGPYRLKVFNSVIDDDLLTHMCLNAKGA